MNTNNIESGTLLESKFMLSFYLVDFWIYELYCVFPFFILIIIKGAVGKFQELLFGCHLLPNAIAICQLFMSEMLCEISVPVDCACLCMRQFRGKTTPGSFLTNQGISFLIVFGESILPVNHRHTLYNSQIVPIAPYRTHFTNYFYFAYIIL